MSPEADDGIPTLTDVVTLESSGLAPEVLAQLQADICAAVLKLAQELLHAASRDMEAVLFERVCDRLRDRLPDIVDQALRERLGQSAPASKR